MRQDSLCDLFWSFMKAVPELTYCLLRFCTSLNSQLFFHLLSGFIMNSPKLNIFNPLHHKAETFTKQILQLSTQITYMKWYY